MERNSLFYSSMKGVESNNEGNFLTKINCQRRGAGMQKFTE